MNNGLLISILDATRGYTDVYQAKPSPAKLFLCMVQLFSQVEKLMSWQFCAFAVREGNTVEECLDEKEADFE